MIACRPRSGLDQWSGQPNTVRLDELDVICAVLGCGAEELLLPEPETAPQPEPASGEQGRAVAEPARLRRGRAGGRFLLPLRQGTADLSHLRGRQPGTRPRPSSLDGCKAATC